MPIFTWD